MLMVLDQHSATALWKAVLDNEVEIMERARGREINCSDRISLLCMKAAQILTVCAGRYWLVCLIKENMAGRNEHDAVEETKFNSHVILHITSNEMFCKLAIRNNRKCI